MSLLVEVPYVLAYFKHSVQDPVLTELHRGSPPLKDARYSRPPTERRMSVFKPELTTEAARHSSKAMEAQRSARAAKAREAAARANRVSYMSAVREEPVTNGEKIPKDKTPKKEEPVKKKAEDKKNTGKAPALVFEPVGPNQATASSGLAILFPPPPPGVKKNPLLAKIRPGRIVPVSVFFGCVAKGVTEPVVMEISGNASIKQLLECAVYQYGLEERQPEIKTNPLYYQLHLTEDETGTPDEDLPPMEQTQILGGVGVTSFAICFDSKGEEKVRAAETASPAPAAGVQTTDGKGNTFLRVSLPNDRHTTLSVSGDILVKDLLNLISLKRGIPLEGMTVFRKGENDPIEANRTVRSLDTNELCVKRIRDAITGILVEDGKPFQRRRTGSTTYALQKMEVDVNIPISTFSAIKYQEFNVIKINSKGKRQERVLGIDDQKIHNLASRAYQTRTILNPFSSAKVKNPERLMETVIKAVHKNNIEFSIEYTDGTVGNFEAESIGQAAEIVNKINFLCDMRVAPASPATPVNRLKEPPRRGSLLPGLSSSGGN